MALGRQFIGVQIPDGFSSVQVFAIEVGMVLVKWALDFIKRNLLHLRHAEDHYQNVNVGNPATYRPSIKTLRTYEAGGDPLDDMIEFVLKDGGNTPGGFQNPK